MWDNNLEQIWNEIVQIQIFEEPAHHKNSSFQIDSISKIGFLKQPNPCMLCLKCCFQSSKFFSLILLQTLIYNEYSLISYTFLFIKW